MHTLFIYGTLKRGFANFDPYMNEARYIGPAQTKQRFPLVIGGKWFSPCLIEEPGEGHQVLGECFNVSDRALDRLDKLEATHLQNGYRRIKIEVCRLTDDSPQKVWSYVKDRKWIKGIHSEPLEKYRLDPRYIEIANRPI